MKFDPTQPARPGASWIEALLDYAIEASNGELDDESMWLEIKGPLDLNRGGDVAKLAKFILGARNRDPVHAARHIGGYTAMAIGVGGGEAIGAKLVEEGVLADKLRKVIGDDHDWEMHRISRGDTRIAVLLVDPPDGHLHGAHAETGEGKDLVRSGAIYVRARDHTRPPNAGEMGALMKRHDAASNPLPQPEVSVLIEGSVQAFEGIDVSRPRFLELLPDAEPEIAPQDEVGGLGFALAFETSLEAHGSYRARHKKWCKAIYSDYDELLVAAVREQGRRVTVSVTNESDVALEEVEILIDVPEAWTTVWVAGGADRRDDLAPRPSRGQGTRYSSLQDFGLPSVALTPDEESALSIDQGVMTIALSELRPQRQVLVGQFVIGARGDTDASAAPFSATARGVNAVLRGSVDLPAAPLDLEFDPLRMIVDAAMRAQ